MTRQVGQSRFGDSNLKPVASSTSISRQCLGVLILQATALWTLFTLGPIAVKLSGGAVNTDWLHILALPLIVAALLMASYFVWLARACARGG
jgi:hypothetical protein